VGAIYLPPRQHYALVEQVSPNSLAIWHLARPHLAAGKDLLDTISGALAHPDAVAFSPRGGAAALYSNSRAEVQVVTGLPNKPVLQSDFSTSSIGTFTAVALSDDGQVVFAVTSAGQLELASDGKAFRAMPWTYSPLALSFVSGTHDLLLTDARQKDLVLLQQVEAQNSPPVLIGSGLQPDHLAVCAHGDTIVALDTTNQKMWEIDAKTFSVTSVPVAQHSDTLLTLRDGHTFLLSTAPLSLLKVVDSASPALFTSSSADAGNSGKQ
jgi:hypothetical protein